MLIDFRKEVTRLEELKWNILLTKGEQTAHEIWPSIDRRLNKLYAWWSWDMQRTLVTGRIPMSNSTEKGLRLV